MKTSTSDGNGRSTGTGREEAAEVFQSHHELRDSTAKAQRITQKEAKNSRVLHEL